MRHAARFRQRQSGCNFEINHQCIMSNTTDSPSAFNSESFLDIHEVARMEESRQAHSVAAISDLAEPIGGGLMCFAGAGSFANQAMGVGMDRPVDASEID